MIANFENWCFNLVLFPDIHFFSLLFIYSAFSVKACNIFFWWKINSNTIKIRIRDTNTYAVKFSPWSEWCSVCIEVPENAGCILDIFGYQKNFGSFNYYIRRLCLDLCTSEWSSAWRWNRSFIKKPISSICTYIQYVLLTYSFYYIAAYSKSDL